MSIGNVMGCHILALTDIWVVAEVSIGAYVLCKCMCVDIRACARVHMYVRVVCVHVVTMNEFYRQT